MILTLEEIDRIRSRQKTQARLPVATLKPPRPPIPEKTCRYQPGRLYKIQPGHSQRAILQITVTHVTQALLGQTTQQDARREGHRFLSQFMAHWERTHGLIDEDQPVWVISFKAGDHRDEFDQPRLLTSIGHVGHVEFETDHTGRQHWPSHDQDSEDYTDQPHLAMTDAGEALTASQLAPYVKDARVRDNLRRLVPAHGSLARIEDEIRTLRQDLGVNGHIDRGLHRDIVKLEKARAAIHRRLAS